MILTDRNRFGNKHYMFGHKTSFYLSSNLTSLLEKCLTCKIAIPVNDFEKPENLHLLICKARTDYYTECCSCETVVECREKHDCCCRAVLDDEVEKKRLEKKEREAQGLIAKDPELADLICKNQVKDLKKIFVDKNEC